ncbi:MAG: PAS domain S-box protein [Capsulimonas sp.]|uniref:PAS domain S-box protein n=1 Tax=Capsulimonas sp. TaxID=2494211 RepID=UPI003267155C
MTSSQHGRQERFQAAFERASIGMAHFDPSGLWLRANSYLGALLGHDAKTLVGKRIHDIAHPDDLAIEQQAIARVLAGETSSYNVDKRIIRPNGEIIHIKISASLVRDDQDHPDFFLAMIQENPRRGASVGVRRALDRLSQQVQHAPLAVVEWNRDFRISRWSDEAARLFGWSAAETLGRSSAELGFVFDQDISVVENGVARMLVSPDQRNIVRIRNRTRDGRILDCEWYSSVALDRRGRIESILSLVLDVTEKRRAEEEHGRLLERVQQGAAREHALLRDVLASVTEGKLRLCDRREDLPAPLPFCENAVALTPKQGIVDLRRQAEKLAIECGFPDTRWHDLSTAVSEAAMNAVVHAGGGFGQVCVSTPDTIQVRIVDHGAGISIDQLPKATLRRGYTTAGTLGHGLWLVLNTIDRFYLLTGGEGTTVVLEQDLRPIEPNWIDHVKAL